MNCLRCKRKLTNPISIKRGYGNICWKKILSDKYRVIGLKEWFRK